MPFLFLFVLTIGLYSPTSVDAHALLNIGAQDPDPNMPAIPQEYTSPPMADREIQRAVLDMENADCNKLTAMEDDVKHAFLLTSIFLQRPGSLSKIVGPDCTFLGEVEEIAAITDDTLTISGKREVLYYLPEMEVLLVSNKDNNSIAYGFFREEDLEPVEYFLAHREEAERSAAIARTFADTVGKIQPDIIPSPKEIPSTTASSKSSAKTARSRIREDSAVSSASPLLPTDTDTTPPPGFPPSDAMPTQPTDTAQPPQVAQDTPDIIYVDRPSDTLPSIQPIGPTPQPGQPTQGIGYWAFMIFLALALVATAVVVLKSRATAKKGMIDE
ncbi:MAG: hypothetical protein QF793_03805 [Candidatus Peribacteraceae bacterium]|nr:hypothetical protein [Candidatus Peribacteraceae bacterium]